MCFKQPWVGHFVSTRRSDLQQTSATMDEFHVHKMYRNLKKGGGLGGSQAALHQYKFKTYMQVCDICDIYNIFIYIYIYSFFSIQKSHHPKESQPVSDSRHPVQVLLVLPTPPP